VDAIIVVVRVNRVRRHTVTEVRRVLDASPAEKLGLVLTGTPTEDEYGGAYRYRYHRPHDVGDNGEPPSSVVHERRDVVKAYEDGR
jgi:hypothetical protein